MGRPAVVRNLMIVFLVSGLWHGANWTFVVWGGLHGAYLVGSMMTERVRAGAVRLFGLEKAPSLHRVLQVVITFHLVLVSWVFFRAANLTDALSVLRNMAALGDGLRTLGNFPQSPAELYVDLLLVVFLLAVQVAQERRGRLRDWLGELPLWGRWAIYHAAVALILLLGQFTEQKFIYFQFWNHACLILQASGLHASLARRADGRGVAGAIGSGLVHDQEGESRPSARLGAGAPLRNLARRVGIDPDAFGASGFNLANPNQSLYYDTELLRLYGNRMPHLEMVVFGMSHHSLEFRLSESWESGRQYRYVQVFGIPLEDFALPELKRYSVLVLKGRSSVFGPTWSDTHVKDNGWIAHKTHGETKTGLTAKDAAIRMKSQVAALRP